MGNNSCSHSNFEIYDVDPTIYTDKMKTWHFQVADAICTDSLSPDCNNNKLRAIKKTCVSHGIEQPWEILNKYACKHDVVTIKDKTKNETTHRYEGRSQCVCCLHHIPVFITYRCERN